MAKSVGREIGRSGHGGHGGVDGPAGGTRIEPTASAAEQQRCPAASVGQFGSAPLQPLLQGLRGRDAVRHPPLAVALADDAEQAPGVVDVGEVESA
ncbi:MAG: hypothetical protein QOC98_573, partial [Frankiaceae bacterium]|nr:hypothetical protein [Frankiaceae bacterium]